MMKTQPIVDAITEVTRARCAKNWLRVHLPSGLSIRCVGNEYDRYLDQSTKDTIALLVQAQIDRRVDEAETALAKAMKDALAANEAGPDSD